MPFDTDPTVPGSVIAPAPAHGGTAGSSAPKQRFMGQIGGGQIGGAEREPVATRNALAGTSSALLENTKPYAWRSLSALAAWARRQPLWRWCVGSLANRIITANFIGMLMLMAGLGFLTFQHSWLIEARTESLKTQGRMIAVAIASNAKLQSDSLIIDPDEPGRAGRFTILDDDVLSKFSLEIAPERVAPVLRRLVQNNDIRVRVYTRENRLLVDSEMALLDVIGTGQSMNRTGFVDGIEGPVVMRDWWTRFISWVQGKSVEVYRDLPSSRAHLYPEAKQALNGKLGHMILIDDNGQQMIAVTAPIERAGNIPGLVLVTTRPGVLSSILERERRPFIVLFMLSLIATGLASWLLTRTIGGPMRELSRTADLVSRNINARHDLPSMPDRSDEIGQMARNFTTMTEALLRRIEASDRFAQDVAHELKNPVAAAQSTAEALMFAKTPEKRDEIVQQVRGELKRLNRLITDVSNASRLDADLARQETAPVDLAAIAGNIAGVFRDIQSGQSDTPTRIEVVLEPATGSDRRFVVDGHEGRLGQVVTNLLDNALSFSPSRDALVTLQVTALFDQVVLTIEDQGPGIPPEKLEDVFKRFYSDRPQSDRTKGKNSGLGLSISREIVEAHGGSIRAENIASAPGTRQPVDEMPELAGRRIPGVAGVRFEVRLPRIKTKRK